MENNTFTYQYSAARNREVETIRKKYMPREEDKLETLKRLDLRVRNAGVVESLSMGIPGALIFGIGLCFFLDVFVGAIWIAALLMTAGGLLMIPAYPLYKRIAHKTRTALTPEILRLSEEILKS